MQFKSQADVLREQHSIFRRVANMPLVSSTYDMAATAYKTTKNNHPYVKFLWDAAEEGIKTVTKAAVYSAQPILTILEPQIARASKYASKSLDTLEEKLPILQMTADKVASNTKEMVSAKMASAKDSIASTLSGAVSRTKGAVQNSMAGPASFLRRSLNTVALTGKIAVDSAEALLMTSEMLVDNYVPISDEELRELTELHDKAFAEWIKNRPEVPIEDMVPQEEAIMLPGPEQVDLGYLGRWRTLLRKIRLRAFHHSLGRINRRNIQQMIENYRFRLQQRIYRLRAKIPIWNQWTPKPVGLVWLDPNKLLPDPNVDKDKVETQTLTISQSMIEQLRTAYRTLVSSIQEFPSSLQDSVRQIHQSIGKLPSTLLAQSHEKILKAQKFIDQLVFFVAFDTPLEWLLSTYVIHYWPTIERETNEDYPNEAELYEDYATEAETDEDYTNETESEEEYS